MRTTVNLFKELSGSTVLSTPKHKVITRAMGWGEPLTFGAYCICGWVSLQVEEDFEGTDMFIPQLRPFVEKYGKNAVHRGKAIYGNSSTIVRMCLDHLGLPLSDMLMSEVPELDRLREKLANGNITSEEAGELKSIAERLMVITAALEIDNSEPLPELEPVSAEVIAEYEEILRKVRAPWETPAN